MKRVTGIGGIFFAPSTSAFMNNFRVDDLCSLLQGLRNEGCRVLDKVELWQPPPGQ
jgi:hypothetical protein